MQSGYTIIDAPSLAARTTMGLGGTAAFEICVSDSSCLENAWDELLRLAGSDNKIVAFGGGSNLIVQEGKLPLALLSFSRSEEPKIIAEQDNNILLRVSSGVRLPSLLGKVAKWGFTGLENLSGIPGSLGGSVYMNAGSYGASISNVLQSIQVFTPEEGLVEYRPEDFSFSYRSAKLHSANSWYVVTNATLALQKDNPEAVRERMKAVFAQKRSTQPVTVKSAGCVFQNPEGASAGQLLDRAGFKGKGVRKNSVQGMHFSPQHANFLVNGGSGTFAEAQELILLARDAVKNLFDVDLELEVRIWP